LREEVPALFSTVGDFSYSLTSPCNRWMRSRLKRDNEEAVSRAACFKSSFTNSGLKSPAMNEHLPFGGVQELHSLARKNIERQKRLLTETDQLMRNSRNLISRTEELIRRKSAIKTIIIVSCSRQHNGNHSASSVPASNGSQFGSR
jgi:hypothetical protein